jgi:site-specific DNA-methyltransferase (adenine-specific)
MDDQPHVEIRLGDCRGIIATLPDNSVDSIVTDPPYELGFMGKKWDATGIAYDVTLWEQCLRVLKPGGHLLAFGGTRTYHRMTCAIEDSGFEIRDCIVWLYSSGFPKSHNVSLSIDKMNGHKNRGRAIPTASTFQASDTEQKHKLVSNPVGPYIAKSEHSLKWDGWGTALKPANEPIVLARKPLTGTVAANVTEYGTGAMNIDGTRIDMGDEYDPDKVQRQQHSAGAIDGAFGAASLVGKEIPTYNAKGRWPANVIANENMNEEWGKYFFTPKASRTERNAGLTALEWKHTDFGGGGKPGAGFNEVTHGKAPAHAPNNHPTVKPLALMRYLVRLITPPGGTVLEPFAGSGTTLMAAVMEGFNAIGCEITDEYIEIIERRVQWARDQYTNQQSTLFGDTDG